MSVSYEYCVFSSTVLCVGADHLCRGALANVVLSHCVREVSIMGRPWPTRCCRILGGKTK